MAKKSLPATPSSYNDIEDLAGLLEDNFQYQSNRNPSHKEEYIDSLNLIIGLSLTVIMVRRTFFSTVKSDFNRFLDGFNFSSLPQYDSIKPVAREAARVMYEAARFFPTVERCRDLRDVFRKTLKLTVKSGLLDKSKNQEISTRLLKTMLKQDYYH
ncbi:MAG: hypothetical protein JO131_08335 [Gammaproteobacteria bacterium]|nr:hypothetical protein [Gammaproteobacteria bacterium]MBV9471123.1 hypothetical protein [Abditibacteriaceae bacterium]